MSELDICDGSDFVVDDGEVVGERVQALDGDRPVEFDDGHEVFVAGIDAGPDITPVVD